MQIYDNSCSYAQKRPEIQPVNPHFITLAKRLAPHANTAARAKKIIARAGKNKKPAKKI